MSAAALTRAALATVALRDLAEAIESDDQFPVHQWSCTAAEALADALRVQGHDQAAATVIANHARNDERGDPHYLGAAQNERKWAACYLASWGAVDRTLDPQEARAMLSGMTDRDLAVLEDAVEDDRRSRILAAMISAITDGLDRPQFEHAGDGCRCSTLPLGVEVVAVMFHGDVIDDGGVFTDTLGAIVYGNGARYEARFPKLEGMYYDPWAARRNDPGFAYIVRSNEFVFVNKNASTKLPTQIFADRAAACAAEGWAMPARLTSPN